MKFSPEGAGAIPVIALTLKAPLTAEGADVVVLCPGENRRWSGENAPMASISLPAAQEELLSEVKKAGKPVVLALFAGRPLDLSRMEPLADAIVMMWQPGIPGGKPLAGILSDSVNPSGKLSITFPPPHGRPDSHLLQPPPLVA